MKATEVYLPWEVAGLRQAMGGRRYLPTADLADLTAS